MSVRIDPPENLKRLDSIFSFVYSIVLSFPNAPTGNPLNNIKGLMNTKLLMTAASLVLGITGISLSFLPQEISILLHAHTTTTLTIILQLLGALYFGFAMLNWMAKDSPLGGIYGRPIIVGNVTHFVVGAFALLKVLSQNQEIVILIAAIVYALFAMMFTMVMYRTPNKKDV